MIVSGSSLWSPLASVIAFGLLGSMFFTLVAIPVLFVVVHRKHAAAAPAKAVAALLLLFALTGVARAETRRITLEEAVALATKQNSIVKLAHLKEKEMQARVGEARANYFPVLSNESDAAHLRSIEHMEIPMGALGVYTVPGPVPGTNTSLRSGTTISC